MSHGICSIFFRVGSVDDAVATINNPQSRFEDWTLCGHYGGAVFYTIQSHTIENIRTEYNTKAVSVEHCKCVIKCLYWYIIYNIYIYIN